MFRLLFCAVLGLLVTADLSFAAKKGGMVGKVVTFNAETGDLSVAGGKKGKGPTKQFKLTDSVTFIIFEGDVSKKMNAKDGFKELKSGDMVKITADAGGKVTEVQIGGLKKKK